jgi:hypothetical protein
MRLGHQTAAAAVCLAMWVGTAMTGMSAISPESCGGVCPSRATAASLVLSFTAPLGIAALITLMHLRGGSRWWVAVLAMLTAIWLLMAVLAALVSLRVGLWMIPGAAALIYAWRSSRSADARRLPLESA